MKNHRVVVFSLIWLLTAILAGCSSSGSRQVKPPPPSVDDMKRVAIADIDGEDRFEVSRSISALLRENGISCSVSGLWSYELSVYKKDVPKAVAIISRIPNLKGKQVEVRADLTQSISGGAAAAAEQTVIIADIFGDDRWETAHLMEAALRKGGVKMFAGGLSIYEVKVSKSQIKQAVELLSNDEALKARKWKLRQDFIR